MTSAFVQHKLVQKPSKQHRFDCLASKLYSSRVAHLNWPVTSKRSLYCRRVKDRVGLVYTAPLNS